MKIGEKMQDCRPPTLAVLRSALQMMEKQQNRRFQGPLAFEMARLREQLRYLDRPKKLTPIMILPMDANVMRTLGRIKMPVLPI